MPRKSAKQIVDEVVAKVKEETPKVKAKAEEPKEPEVEHYFRCMTVIAPGSKCNCYAFN
jgi:hypothetical protein